MTDDERLNRGDMSLVCISVEEHVAQRLQQALPLFRGAQSGRRILGRAGDGPTMATPRAVTVLASSWPGLKRTGRGAPPAIVTGSSILAR